MSEKVLKLFSAVVTVSYMSNINVCLLNALSILVWANLDYSCFEITRYIEISNKKISKALYEFTFYGSLGWIRELYAKRRDICVGVKG
jgi:hypothetical protein